MKKQTGKITGRLIALTMMIVLVLTVLTSCGTGSATPTLTFNNDAFLLDDEQSAEHGLKPTQLSEVSKMLSAAYAAGFDVQEALIAASRGYDMTASDFDDSKVEIGVAKEFSLDAAKKVIEKANLTAASQEDVLSDGELEQVIANLNRADVELLISACQTTVDLTAGNDLISTILGAIGTVLNWLTNTLGFGNYVLGICLFAVIIEILMLPFAIKQQKNSIKQASLRPKEMAIKNKYKGRNDQPTMQKMQAEIQDLYQRENFSPYSGCLPLLVQLPIIMALYSIVMDPLHYVLGQASSMTSALTTYAGAAHAAGGLGASLSSTNGTIEILSYIKTNGTELLNGLKDFSFFSNGSEVFNALDPVIDSIPNFNIGPFNFGLVPNLNDWSNWILLLVPVITFATYFATAKLNRKFMYQSVANEGADARQVACSNNMMDITMPAMSAFFTMAVPSVIGIYWAFRSWIGLLKTFIMSKVMPLPTFTEADYKAAAKEMASSKHVVKKSERAGSVRSLHYIDDEDFEDTRERGLARKAAIEERERREQENKAKATPFGALPMKESNKQQKKSKKKDAEEQPSEAPSDTAETQENDNNQDEV